MATRIEHALALAGAGFYLFPCQVNGRKPAAEGWQEIATQDPTMLWQWFAEHDFNIGVHVGKSGHMVVDLDCKNGKDGVASLGELELSRGEFLPETFTVGTPSGGRHLYLKGEARNSVGKLGSGIDIRGKGGYVLGPGSIIDGRPYNSCTSDPIAEAPAWFLEQTGRPRDKDEKPREKPVVELDIEENIWRAADWLQHAPVAVAFQSGNDRTYRTACKVRDFGLSEAITLAVMEGWNERCDPPWSIGELKDIVGHAYRYASSPAGEMSIPTPETDPFARVEALDDPMPAARKRFQPLTKPELVALKDPEWLIEDSIPEEALGMIWGAPSSFKSFLALDLACCVATGRPWHGKAVRQGKVLYFAGEGSRGIRIRLEGWERAHQVVTEDFLVVPEMPEFRKPEDCAAVAEVIDEHQPRLIIIDTKALASIGYDENSSADMSAFMSRMDWMRRQGATVILIHHGTKTDNTERGSSAIRAALDVSFHCQATSDQLAVEMTKQKDAEKWIAKRYFRMKQQETPWKSTLILEPSKAPQEATRLGIVWRPLLGILASWPKDEANHDHVLESLSQQLMDEDGVPRVRNLKQLFSKPKDWGCHKADMDALIARWHGVPGFSKPDAWDCVKARALVAKWAESVQGVM